MTRLLIAPDAFKGTLSAREVAAAIARGVRSAGGAAEECPVADGGEGTIDVLLATLGGTRRTARCHDPLGREIDASWVWIESSRTALLEMASASGLALVEPEERDAERATSVGTGELLLAARDAGAREAILAIGGTATSDGGRGAVEAIERGGGVDGIRILLACDVHIPFEDAAVVFGPQKGASPTGVERLTKALVELADALPRDPRGRSMTGAGGGLAGTLWARYEAELCEGASFVLDALGFDERLHAADAVVVGEGCLDGQTRQGKIAGEVARRAATAAVAVHAIVGSIEGHPEQDWPELASVQVAGTADELEAAGAELHRRIAR